MKQLVCEMCGSTDLVKQDGVFVCQTCGCKYSVEEAKKMMVEGTVQVEGTVKVDTSEKLKNLYALARRAGSDKNYEKAAEYYSQAVVEDPENWEAAFYSVYYTALNCRIGEISSAAKSISNCLETVMKLIQNNVPVNEQRDAYTEVANYTMAAGTFFFTVAKDTYQKSSYSNRRNDLQDNAAAALFTIAAAGIEVVEFFDDVILANKIYNNGLSLCESFNPTKVYSKLFRQYISQIEPRIAKEQEKRNREYWEQHEDERQALLEKKQSLTQQISDLNNEVSGYTESEEMQSLKKELEQLSGQKTALGLFKAKEKRALQTQIDEVNAKLMPFLDEQAQTKAALRKQVDALRGQLQQISDELEKAR